VYSSEGSENNAAHFVD